MPSIVRSSRPSFLTATRALQLYQLMRLGSVIVTSILLAKSGLQIAEIGIYEALLYIGTVAAFFWANGLLQGIPPVYVRLPDKEQQAFVFNKFLVFGGISLLVVLFLWLGQGWVVPALTGLPEVPWFGWFCLYLFFNLSSLPVEYLYLLHEKPWSLLGWGGASFGLYVLALWLPVQLGWGLHGGLVGLASLGALRFIWSVSLVFRYGRLVLRVDLIGRYLRFSLPLMLNLLVGNLVLLFDNWLVGWYYRDEALFAVFRYGSREFPLATALATALGTSMIALLTVQPEQGLAELKIKTRRLFHLVFPLTILLLFLSKPLFPWIFNPNFAASAPLFNIYLLMTASRLLLPNAIVLAEGKPKAILTVGLFELVVKIVFGFWFIHWWGLPGVAWSAVVAFWVEKAGLIWYLERRLHIRTKDWLDTGWYAGYVTALLAAWLLVSGS